MNEELKLSDLLKEKKVNPYAQKSARDFYDPVDTYNSIRNNTTIEDAVTSQPDYLSNGTLTQKVQLLNDKKNQYDLINSKLRTLDIDVAEEFGGRGITRLGNRAQILTQGRELDSERRSVLSDMEYLRGNVQTAERLARSSRGSGKSKGGDGEVSYDFINGSETQNVSDNQRNDLLKVLSIINPELGEKAAAYDNAKLAKVAKSVGINVGTALGKSTGLVLNDETINNEFLTQTPDEYQDYVLQYYKDK